MAQWLASLETNHRGVTSVSSNPKSFITEDMFQYDPGC